MFGRLSSSLDAVLYGYIPRYARRSVRFLRSNAGRILYYILVTAALAAIAYAAELYRSRPAEPTPQPSLQASVVQDAPEVALLPLAERLPTDTQLLRGYSDSVQWNSTLLMWQNHPAIDCRSSAAYALVHGTVSECGTHPVYGGYVRVNSGEFEILYASLLPASAVSEGKQVRAGDFLGTPDASMPSECHMGGHLHIEVLCNGKPQNPYTLQVESNLMD